MSKDEQNEYSSPACSMHEVDPAYMGLDTSLPRKNERKNDKHGTAHQSVPSDEQEESSRS
mgnify:CR=1 FL=1|jgi:hypothetical protein